jgi:polysaccharide biosynthesis transport protein
VVTIDDASYQIENPKLTSVSGPEYLAFTAFTPIRAGIDFAVRFLRRRYLIIVTCLLLSLAFGALYLLIAPKNYTAYAVMMIETRKSPLQSLPGDAPPDAAWIESQIQILKSRSVAADVVKRLQLAEDPEFLRSLSLSLSGLLDKLLARLDWVSVPEATRTDAAIGTLTDAAIRTLNQRLDVQRLSQSYMLEINFSSSNPKQAIKVVNVLIDAYVFHQLNAMYQANRRAGDWMEERLQALREQAATAERAVIEFKAKNNIVAAAGGTLMSETQLSEISGELASARSHASDVKARLERIEAVRQSYQEDQPASAADESVVEALNNPIITKLRMQYLDLVTREGEFSERYGKNHGATVNLRREIRDARRSIGDELGRIAETYRSELAIAKKRQDEAEKRLGALVSQSTETNQAQVTLFSLEAAALSYRKLYDSFLRQHTEAVQQQSLPVSDAQEVSPASIIKADSRSSRFVIFGMIIFAGGILGVGFGVLRDLMDRGFRTREHVQFALETECVALVPRLLDGRSNKVSWRTIVEAPSSPYAEAIRSIKLTLDLDLENLDPNLKSEKTSSNVIGLTSCLPKEGKSTIAAAMARLIAKSGTRVILVDCDVRNPSLTRALAPDAKMGVLELIDGKVDLADAVLIDSTTKMAFLPTVASPNLPNSTELLASGGAKSLFTALRMKYDYVIVDLAPLTAGFDVRASSRLIDSYLLVIEWGSTKMEAVQYAVRNASIVRENIIGAVLNKVDMAVMGLYDSYGASNYYYGRGGGDARATS